MELIVETDIGGDPDDCFALCYLLNAGVDIKAIIVSPGHPYQIGLAKFICDYIGVDIPIGGSDYEKYKVEDYTGFNKKAIDLWNIKIDQKYDDYGYRIIEDVYRNNNKVSFLGLGPLKNTGEFLRRNPNVEIEKFYMQGGFVSYLCCNDPNTVQLEKFKGAWTVPTFNLNGDPKSAELLVDSNVKDRRFVGKNVCHSVIFDRNKYDEFCLRWANKKMEKPYELFMKLIGLYSSQNKEKKFHDPTACACLLHPEIANWTEGKPFREKGKWGFDVSKKGTLGITSIDYDKL